MELEGLRKCLPKHADFIFHKTKLACQCFYNPIAATKCRMSHLANKPRQWKSMLTHYIYRLLLPISQTTRFCNLHRTSTCTSSMFYEGIVHVTAHIVTVSQSCCYKSSSG